MGSKSPITAEAATHRQTPAVPPDVREEKYPDLRAKAMDQRRCAKPGDTPADMKQLYEFWSHCLVDKFNVRMYNEFRSYALEDARRDIPSSFGLESLLQYYKRVLGQSKDAAGTTTASYPTVFTDHQMEAQQQYNSRIAMPNGEAQV